MEVRDQQQVHLRRVHAVEVRERHETRIRRMNPAVEHNRFAFIFENKAGTTDLLPRPERRDLHGVSAGGSDVEATTGPSAGASCSAPRRAASVSPIHLLDRPPTTERRL